MERPLAINLSELHYQDNGTLVLVFNDGKKVVVEPGGSAYLEPVSGASQASSQNLTGVCLDVDGGRNI